MTIKKALLTIKGYCEKHISCDRCQLHDKQDNLLCSLKDAIPADWDVEEMFKKRRDDDGGHDLPSAGD